ncbi:MAG TPA: alpha/beta fold hydrolase [Fimbriimonadaceae bacterium]|nr:alpha/beta fold hydrolase [Fimbriimonadaceae bacterium]
MHKTPILFLILLLAACGSSQSLPRRSFFGIVGAPITPEIRAERKLPATGGVLVSAVTPGSTAAAGGIEPGDVLLALNGKVIENGQVFASLVNENMPGTKVKVKINRSGTEREIEMTMVPKPSDKGQNYEVIYDHVVSKGARLRTFVSRPTHVAGKRPVLFLIQGIGQFSHDSPLTGPGSYSRIRKAFNDKGFVTLAVDKPGIGDSEGKPFSQITWEEDVDAFRQAINSLRKYDFVDLDNVFIFGHSMGGCEGPIIASEFPVKGLAVYGTVVRTWHEYVLENTRRQSVLAGGTHAQVDQQMRGLMAALHLLFDENLSPAEAKEKRPQWASAIDGFTPDGRTMSGMPLTFWQGCFDENYAQYWEKLKCDVGVFFGENEFIASQVDHPLIAEIVNRVNPGKAQYIVVPDSDHGFFKTSSMADSFRRWGPGQPKEFNPVIIELLEKWVDEVMAKKQ